MIGWVTLAVLLLFAAPAVAQEAWCVAHPTECVCSETFQSTAYTSTGGDASAQHYFGTQANSKPCVMNAAVGSHNASVVVWNNFLKTNTFAANLVIGTNATILNLLPNRDPVAVARYLQMTPMDINSIAYQFGYSPMTLNKRLELRWYSYHSSSSVAGGTDYQWSNEGSCTNGKIFHNSNGIEGAPVAVLTVNGAPGGGVSSWTYYYAFVDSGLCCWIWPGHSGFDGFSSFLNNPRPAGVGNGVPPISYRGNWFRHSVVVTNPRASDTGGYDFHYYVKNITLGTAEVEDFRMSAGCAGCMTTPSAGAFAWNSGVRPSADLTAFHTEFFREATCLGTQAWVYAAVAAWTTDAGQRIGAATEVESGGGGPTPPAAPTNLHFGAWDWLQWLLTRLGVAV